MGFLDRFKKKKLQSLPESEPVKEALDVDTVKLEATAVNLNLAEDRTAFIKDNCDQILETGRQIEEFRIEYQLVTSYLMDIQKIERIPPEEKEDLSDAARNIITLSRDRAKYQKSDSKISEVQYKQLENYEDIMPGEIFKIQEKETYQLLIKNDMRQLEGEKKTLIHQKKESIAKQSYLKGLSFISCIITGLLFLLFVTIAVILDSDMMIPFIMTVMLAMILVVYILFQARKNQFEGRLVQRKLNRAITLLNKVKIKYINNRSALDYTYNKFNISSSQELDYLWQEYVKAREAARRYKNNTESLHFYNETLIKELKRFEVVDPEVWIYQSVAVIDNKEMVEVRHRLNVRRAKLRELIDYNTKIKEGCLNEVDKIIKLRPELRPEIISILSTYHINVTDQPYHS